MFIYMLLYYIFVNNHRPSDWFYIFVCYNMGVVLSPIHVLLMILALIYHLLDD